jgi:hypothetical protein
MQPPVSSNALRFRGFMLALFSSVSTAVFSESALHGSFTLAMMAIALAGMIVSAAFLQFQLPAALKRQFSAQGKLQLAL